MNYQALSKHNISGSIWESAEIGDHYYRVDVIWSHLMPKLSNLSEIAESVLVVPHSNAREERVLSIIRMNKIECRPRFNLGRSLIPPCKQRQTCWNY